MAIGQAVHIAAGHSPERGVVAFSSLDGLDLEEQPPWGKYVSAAADQLEPLALGSGALLAIDSDLPSTGGLSSSSALTVGCLLALSQLWGVELTPDKLIDHALTAERSAAIAGGAMDQTVIALAEPGHALRIDFDPFLRRHVPVPETFNWVAAYSGDTAPKGDTAADAYNSFVLASRAAAAAIGRVIGVDAGDPPLLSRVAKVAGDEVDTLPTVSVAEAAAMTGGDDLDLQGDRPLDLATSATHVLSEAARVDKAETALRAADIDMFGKLMDESHESLRRYGSSTANLDRLVTAARDAGAAGARVTGAGFGGWAIALAGEQATQEVRAAMDEACGGPTFVAAAEGGALWSLQGV